MPARRRPRSWWKQTVARYRRSGLSAREFAERQDISERTLSWWTSTLRRATRAERGPSEATSIEPIEIDVGRAAVPSAHRVEVELDGMHVRVQVGADVEYVRELVRALGARREC